MEEPTTSDLAAKVERLDLRALGELRKAVNRRIQQLEKEHKTRALEAVEATAAEHGLTYADLASHFRRHLTRAGSSVPKYRHPETGETWGGIGRKPKWVKAFEAGGGRLEEIAVNCGDKDGEGPVH